MAGLKSNRRKNGPKFAFCQKYFSSKKVAGEKEVTSDTALPTWACSADGDDMPRGAGLEDKRRKEREMAPRKDMVVCLSVREREPVRQQGRRQQPHRLRPISLQSLAA
mmetsp:Transcript_58574/g.136847  ORF Transcript_58574/g.136847 Transcript_58574/m.136847 type:complete len:108 (-) Transcript_58574:7-330(-)